MTDFNKETFVKEYMETLTSGDMDALNKMAQDLPAEDKMVALDAVIEALKADEDLTEEAAKILLTLEDAKRANEELVAKIEAVISTPAEGEEAAEETKEEA